MPDTKNPVLLALIEVMNLVPKHRRSEVRGACQVILEPTGHSIEQHEYLFGSRPMANSPMVPDAHLPRQLGARRFAFMLAKDDGDTRLASGRTSLTNLAKFAGKSPKTIYNYMADPRKTVDGVTQLPHTYLEGPDHVVRFLPVDDDPRKTAVNEPELFEALDLLRTSQAATARRKKY